MKFKTKPVMEANTENEKQKLYWLYMTFLNTHTDYNDH